MTARDTADQEMMPQISLGWNTEGKPIFQIYQVLKTQYKKLHYMQFLSLYLFC